MARNFNQGSGNSLSLALGRLNFGPPYCVLVVARVKSDATDEVLIRCFNGGFTAGWEFRRQAANTLQMRHFRAAGEVNISTVGTVTQASGWLLLGMEKLAGNPNVVGFPAGTVPDGAITVGLPGSINDYDTGMTDCDFSNGDWDIACAGVWDRTFTQTELNNAALTSNFYNWTQLAPSNCRGLWRFNQALVTETVRDYTGQGADQDNRSGTTAIQGPDGFEMDFSYVSAPPVML